MTLTLALLPLKLQVSLHYHIWQRKNHVIQFTTTNLFGESQRNNNKRIRLFTRSNVFWTINKLLNLAENFMSNNYFWNKKNNYERTKYQACFGVLINNNNYYYLFPILLVCLIQSWQIHASNYTHAWQYRATWKRQFTSRSQLLQCYK